MPALRLVLDTNVLLAGIASESSASQRIVDLLQRRKAIPLLSPAVLAEYRAVLTNPKIVQKFPELTARRTAVVLSRLCYIGDEFGDFRLKFRFPRDPLDAKFIELAIVGNATHIITLDEDLLSLTTATSDAGRRLKHRLPKLEIVRPGKFLSDHAAALELE